MQAAARMFATETPSCAMEGMGVAHQPNSYGAIAARHIISAIVGNVDVKGGEELLGPAPFITEHEIELPEALPVEQREKILGKQFKLYSWPGYEMVQSNVERVSGANAVICSAIPVWPPHRRFTKRLPTAILTPCAP